MPQNVKQIDVHTFRETYGRYYEEFEVGHVYQHRPGLTISEADNTFTLLTMNTHPLHFDAEYGRHLNLDRFSSTALSFWR